ncbi:magnesium-translocating P-type ATPase [Nocardia vaccinii]|uniref:magnesium-translocating P-type ATPase n=1 Tax=Nocardia vaccinii TaxID=1822 RepID=UPI000831A383|nr:magnesium-translocating P-type ATPase [Nocardia vaccinii]
MAAAEAAVATSDTVLATLHSTPDGLTTAETARRLSRLGPNAVRSHRARLAPVLARQLRSPLLLLLATTAVVSFFLGESSDALIIGVILIVSVGLGAFNEYRAERAAEALHERIRHRVVAVRDGSPRSVDLVELVPGDVVELRAGELVPADVRLLTATGMQCDESVLTGESAPVRKSTLPVATGAGIAELTACALMGTVVSAGSGRGVVVATAGATEFGRIALGLGAPEPPTEFQVGLRRFSMLLVWVAATLTSAIFLVNIALHRPILDALLFSLAIAVGISPQLLPAVVSTSLAAGSRRLARCKVLVKRLVCIEDLGDIEVLFTDKTGTLTEGRIEFTRAVDAAATASDTTNVLGMVCTDAVLSAEGIVGGDSLDTALWAGSPAKIPAARAFSRIATLPFDSRRRLASVLAEDPAGNRLIITKGAPEEVLSRCIDVPEAAHDILDAEFGAGHRIVAVATRPAADINTLDSGDEHGLTFCGFLVFLDPPKSTARQALQRLAGLGVAVKIITGDNPVVAAHICGELGLPPGELLTGADIHRLTDEELTEKLGRTTIFARVDPEQKARIVRLQRLAGLDVAFLGDGVNDALALHAADVGISVDSATDVAKDAADVVLLQKDLQVLADGVVEGRRIFANTIKYVLMGTSSNFGNMFSAAGASALLPFLPMLPSQILLNNLLYDTSQLAIPTDRVDEEQLTRPTRWDIGLIRRFMLVFGPVSSVFDFATFGLMLWVFHAGAGLFHTGWFVESLATQTLVLFVIRTRRSPFFRSRPSVPLLTAVLGAVAVGVVLPATPMAADLGFQPLPGGYFVALGLMILTYLVLAEIVKYWFFRASAAVAPTRTRRTGHRIHRRAARFSA